MTEGHLAGPLSTSVAGLCHRLRPQVGEQVAAGLTEVRRRLRAPLQVAVAGRLKAGKSTLVNALIGRRIAPTDVGECTRLVTHFRYGSTDGLEVVASDGTRRSVPLAADGSLPASLGREPEGIDHLEVSLASAALRGMTVIDTPGLGSLDSSSAARTERLLGAATGQATGQAPGQAGAATGHAGHAGQASGAASGQVGERLDETSRQAVAGAEAVLYVVTQNVREHDRAVLDAFTAATAGRAVGPVNAIAVLNKADTITPESVAASTGDTWSAARLLAEAQEAALAPRVAGVLPVIALLAESGEAGGFGEADAAALGQLAALDETTLQTMLLSADLFTTWDCPVPAPAREHLLQALDLYGIRRCVDLLRAEPASTPAALRRAMVEASGLIELRHRLQSVFAARADAIKASAALATIHALAEQAPEATERARIRDAVEVLLATSRAHRLRLLEAVTQVCSGAVAMPEELTTEILRVGSNADVAEALGLPGAERDALLARALERAGWWRAFGSTGASPAQSRIAHIVHRTYFLLWQRLGGIGT